MRRRFSVLFLALAAVGACTPPETPPTAASASAGPPQVTDSTRGEIVAVYERRYDALRKRDLSAYQKTYDVTKLALRRCLQDSFDIAGRQGVGAVPEVVKVEAYGNYVRAYVFEGFGYRRVYFRKTESGFVQSEPSDAELGGEKVKTFDGLEIAYWSIDEDVIDVIAKSALQARNTVLQNLLSPETREPFGIRFYPTRGVAGVVGCSVVGSAVPGDPFLRMYRYYFTKDASALSNDTISFVQHEALHWAQDQYIKGILARLPWFVAEGWPDYIGEARSLSTMKHVICNTPTPTFKQLSDGLIITPETPQELPGQYYSFANTMVEYLYLQLGGKDAYARLLTAYKDGVNAEVNFPKVLGVTPAQFYDGWIAFAKKKYC